MQWPNWVNPSIICEQIYLDLAETSTQGFRHGEASVEQAAAENGLIEASAEKVEENVQTPESVPQAADEPVTNAEPVIQRNFI